MEKLLKTNEKLWEILEQSERSLCFIDLETTGLDVENDRIVQIAIKKITKKGKVETYKQMIDPEMPIPVAAQDIHGISNEDVLGKPTFEEAGYEIDAFITNSDLVGYHSNAFDIPLLFFEFERVGIKFDFTEVNLIDIRNIFVRNSPRTLSEAAKFYGLNLDQYKLHDAEDDADITFNVFLKQLETHDLNFESKSIAKYSNFDKKKYDFKNYFVEKDNVAHYNFGKNKGIPCLEDKSYLKWIISNEGMRSDVRLVAQKILDGKIK